MTKQQQQEGGFLGTLLAFIGIPWLMNALTGKGLHVGPHLPTNTRIIYVPKTGRGKKKRQRSSSREKQSVQQYSNNRSNIVSRSAPRDKVVNIEKPLSSIDLNKLIKELNIKKFRGIFSRDNLPKRIRKEECGIINLDDFLVQVRVAFVGEIWMKMYANILTVSVCHYRLKLRNIL